MMKYNYMINIALGSVLVVPALTLQNGTSDSLADALEKTVEALEAVAGIEQRVQDGSPEAVAEIVRYTEQPITNDDDPGAPDRMLETLREQVAMLQIEVDDARREDHLVPLSAFDDLILDEPPVNLPAGTTGLDDGMRQFLSAPLQQPTTKTPRPVVAQPTPLPTEAPAETRPASLEGEGYTADALRLGRALYQKGRYQEGLDVLERLSDDQEARYWRARCLEKLSRFGEALDAFGTVASDPAGGHFTDRAREDIDFLRWRMSFQGQGKDSK